MIIFDENKYLWSILRWEQRFSNNNKAYPGRHELLIRETGTEFIVHLTISLEQEEKESLEVEGQEQPKPVFNVNTSQA